MPGRLPNASISLLLTSASPSGGRKIERKKGRKIRITHQSKIIIIIIITLKKKREREGGRRERKERQQSKLAVFGGAQKEGPQRDPVRKNASGRRGEPGGNGAEP